MNHTPGSGVLAIADEPYGEVECLGDSGYGLASTPTEGIARACLGVKPAPGSKMRVLAAAAPYAIPNRCGVCRAEVGGDTCALGLFSRRGC